MGLELTAVNGLPVVEKITHLSHWIQLPSDVLVHAIAMAFSSGTGIICKYQRDVDLIVPVLLDDRTEIWEADPNSRFLVLLKGMSIGPKNRRKRF
jgi:hypothetical protein